MKDFNRRYRWFVMDFAIYWSEAARWWGNVWDVHKDYLDTISQLFYILFYDVLILKQGCTVGSNTFHEWNDEDEKGNVV